MLDLPCDLLCGVFCSALREPALTFLELSVQHAEAAPAVQAVTSPEGEKKKKKKSKKDKE